MRRRQTTSRAAFTLVETVVALAVSSLVLATVLALVRDTLFVRSAAAEMVSGPSSTAALLDLLRRDLTSVSRLPDGGCLFVGRQGAGEAEVRFSGCLVREPRRDDPGGAPEIVLSVVRYVARSDADGRITLFRSSRPWAEVPDVREPPLLPVARGLSSFEAEYSDGVEWHETWGGKSPPRCVRISISRGDTRSAAESGAVAREAAVLLARPLGGYHEP